MNLERIGINLFSYFDYTLADDFEIKNGITVIPFAFVAGWIHRVRITVLAP